jgi:uncharacterized protein
MPLTLPSPRDGGAAAAPRYAHAVRCGVLLGLLMLVSFVVAGRGLGASGAFAVTAGRSLAAMGVVPPAMTSAPPGALADRLPTDVDPWRDWLVLEVVGVFIGGGLSAWLARRTRQGRPAAAGGRRDVPSRGRLTRALVGGVLMGVGARLAWGCTSGLALSGGALMATGAWLFIPIAFGTAIAVTWAARRLPDEVAHG